MKNPSPKQAYEISHLYISSARTSASQKTMLEFRQLRTVALAQPNLLRRTVTLVTPTINVKSILPYESLSCIYACPALEQTASIDPSPSISKHPPPNNSTNGNPAMCLCHPMPSSPIPFTTLDPKIIALPSLPQSYRLLRSSIPQNP
ncbi:hypothetical protein CDD80_3861 [Ophiocordyceps camponoti-rufipedis]|uniref:Uncharacterized protein n=1 Tax=Ophiocordyceps camponoti-rufipedis TaxID=2004952 RepID=A0A2C5YX64_9HYPO|nr:hypothetical protein CDD80_3861 [Ophiocordyceps camponoti-rufipedis]